MHVHVVVCSGWIVLNCDVVVRPICARLDGDSDSCPRRRFAPTHRDGRTRLGSSRHMVAENYRTLSLRNSGIGIIH